MKSRGVRDCRVVGLWNRARPQRMLSDGPDVKGVPGMVLSLSKTAT